MAGKRAEWHGSKEKLWCWEKERQRYHRPDAATDVPLGQSILEQCWPRLSTPCKMLLPSGPVRTWCLLDGGWDKQGWRRGNGIPAALSMVQGGWNLTPGTAERADRATSDGRRQHEGKAEVVGWQVLPLCASREMDAAALCLSAWSGDSHFSFIALYRAGRRCCRSSWLAQLYHPSQNLVKKGCRKYGNHVEHLHGEHLL